MIWFFYVVIWCFVHLVIDAQFYEVALEKRENSVWTLLPIWEQARSIRFSVTKIVTGDLFWHIALTDSKLDSDALNKVERWTNWRSTTPFGYVYSEGSTIYITFHNHLYDGDVDNTFKINLTWTAGLYYLTQEGREEREVSWQDSHERGFKYFGFKSEYDPSGWNVQVPLAPCNIENNILQTLIDDQLLDGCTLQDTTYTSQPFGLYQYIPLADNQTNLKFLVKARSVAYIALSSKESVEPPLVQLQVHMGLEHHTKTHLFVRHHEGLVVETPFVLKGERYISFQLTWNHGAVSLWRENNNSRPLVTKEDEDVPLKAKYFGFKTHNDTGDWIISRCVVPT